MEETHGERDGFPAVVLEEAEPALGPGLSVQAHVEHLHGAGAGEVGQDLGLRGGEGEVANVDPSTRGGDAASGLVTAATLDRLVEGLGLAAL